MSTWTEESLMQRLTEIRLELQLTADPPTKEELCAENCRLIGIALDNEWWDAAVYGCSTDETYCGGKCPHCVLLRLARAAMGKMGPEKQIMARAGLKAVWRMVSEVDAKQPCQDCGDSGSPD